MRSKRCKRCFSVLLSFCISKIIKILFLIIIIAIPGKDVKASDSRESVFIGFTNSFLNASVIASSYVKDFMDCAMICLMEDDCLSFNIATTASFSGRNECRLLSIAAFHPNAEIVSSGIYNHYSRMCGTYRRTTDKPVADGRSIKPTCREIKAAFPFSCNGIYAIDPDGNGGEPPIEVFCDMVTRDGVGVTVISHDSEGRIRVKGFEEPASYSRKVNYTGVSLSQLRALTSVSSHCEQFVKYECHHSVLYFHNKWWGWIVSRDGEKWTPFAGATPGTKQCACANNNSCAGGKKCNCDMNDNEWREDSGVLTDRSKLPVIEMKFGDTDRSYEEGYHTLGKLECY